MANPPSRPSSGGGGGDAAGLALIGSAVAQLVVPILLGVWADNQYGWSPWGLVVGTAAGVAGGAVGFWLLYRRANRTKL